MAILEICQTSRPTRSILGGLRCPEVYKSYKLLNAFIHLTDPYAQSYDRRGFIIRETPCGVTNRSNPNNNARARRRNDDLGFTLRYAIDGNMGRSLSTNVLELLEDLEQ